MKQRDTKVIYTRFLITSLILTLFILSFPVGAFAEDFPTREIEMVIGYGPGGSTDMMARLVGDKVSKYLKVPFTYNNKPGGGAAIEANYVAQAKPDGYTVGTLGTSNGGILLAVSDKMPYTLKDIAGISRGVILPLVLFTKKGHFENFAALVKQEKQKPGSVMFGSYGAKSSPHLCGEMLNIAAGIKMKHIPFEGDAKLFVAVLGGHIDVGFGTPAAIVSNLKSGGVTALAVSTPYRLDSMPEVPTLTELGYPDATFVAFDGFVTSSKVPKDRLKILRDAFEKAQKEPDVIEGLKRTGQIPGFINGQEYDAFLASTLDALKKTAAKAGLKE